MILHNIMEDKVIEIVTNIMKGEKDFCCCDRCQLDVIALSLNNTRPKYVVTHESELYGRLMMMDNQYDADIIAEATKAIEIVRENPRHD